MLPQKTLAKNKTFDSYISPSGLLERQVLHFLVFQIQVFILLSDGFVIHELRNGVV